LLSELREKFCHLNFKEFCVEEKQFQVLIPDQPSLQYSIMVGEECLLAPIGLFYPQLFAITSNIITSNILITNVFNF
jgi:actin-related protein 8